MHPTHAQLEWQWQTAKASSNLKWMKQATAVCFQKGGKTLLKLQVLASATFDSEAAAHSRTSNTQGLIYPH